MYGNGEGLLMPFVTQTTKKHECNKRKNSNKEQK